MGGFTSGEATWRRSRLAIPVPTPGAGAEWSLVVPAGYVWRVLAVAGTLTTSATVATREARLTLADATGVVLSLGVAATQAAGLATRYAWTAGGGYAAGSSAGGTLPPDLSLEAGWTLASSTVNLDAGDAWSAVSLLVVQTTFVRGAVSAGELPELYVGVVGSIPE